MTIFKAITVGLIGVGMMTVAAVAQQPIVDGAVLATAQAPAAAPAQVPAQVPAQAPVTAEAAPAWVPGQLFTQSFLFSPAEITILYRATQGNVSGTALLNVDNMQNVPASRTIRVAGVIYRDANDWTVWINGQKATPKNLPPEVVEIHVEQDKVRLKWFDIGLNGILSITMRPHQVYDIVTGIMLPG